MTPDLAQEAEAKFWQYVAKSPTCWLWTGLTHESGFGLLRIGNKYGKFAHIFSYRLVNGVNKYAVTQTCGNRLCVNPAHLISRGPVERFWTHVVKGPNCWIWTGAKDRHGWGNFRARSGRSGGVCAHRFSWALVNGSTKRPLRHLCGNRACVRPDHMVLGRTDPVARFWSYVKKGEGCWLWVGGHQAQGYGTFQLAVRKSVYAHRFMYSLTHGVEPPNDLVVMHKCDNPPCVNPEHLELGTQKQNVQDAHDRGLIGRSRKVA